MIPDALIQRVRYQIGEGDNDQLDTPILYALNTVQRNIQSEINFYETLKSANLTVLTTAQSYDLATEFLKMRTIWNDNTYDRELTRIYPEEYKLYLSDVDTTTGSLYWYDIFDSSSNKKKIYLYPYPAADATVPYMYYERLANLTATGLANILTTFYPDLLISGATYMMYRDEIYRDKPEQIAFREQQYQKQIDLVKKAQRQPDRINRVAPKRILPRKGLNTQTSNYSS